MSNSEIPTAFYPPVHARFIDQLEGESVASAWMEAIVDELKEREPLLDIQQHNLALGKHIVDGHITTLFNNEHIVAIANVIRTPMNYTEIVLTRVSER